MVNQYTISITRPGAEPVLLLVPLSPTSTLLNLVNEIQHRASRLHLNLPDPANISLYLESQRDTLLDHNDLIEHVVLNPTKELIIVICEAQVGTLQIQDSTFRPSSSLPVETLQIRIVTPILARTYPDRNHIPVIPGLVTTQTTLGQIRSLIIRHLGLDVEDFVQFYEECNCCSAQYIYENSLPNDVAADGETNASTRLVVVSSASNVAVFDMEADITGTLPDRSSIIGRLRREYGDMIDLKEVNFIGGVSSSATPSGYAKLPVVAICSKGRHNAKVQETGVSRKCIDIHTSECAITVTDVNIDKTLAELCLLDLAINGIIELYVIERTITLTDMEEPGMDGIFMNSESWNHPIDQREQGMAAMLSSLRVFCHITSAPHMDRQSQDAVIHTIFSLTGFPPVVRAFYTLMRKKPPRHSDRAVICQTIYEVLKEIAPPQPIRFIPQRPLEWSRLLFGLVLEKAKHIKLPNTKARLPYLSSLSVVDLSSTFTQESITNPIMTSAGLMETGLYEALREGGNICRSNGDEPLLLSPKPIDNQRKRFVLLSGAVVSEIIALDFQTVREAYHYSSGCAIVTLKELSDLRELSTFAARNGLSVVPADHLLSTSAPKSAPNDAPVLTLDSRGLLSVYVGIAAGDRNIALFRPTAAGEEVLHVPDLRVLSHKEKAVTSLPDASGERQRLRDPEEVVVVVLDTSRSMDDSADFVELDDTKNPNDNATSDELKIVDNLDFIGKITEATFQEVKTALASHESLDDIVATLQAVPDDRRRDVAIKFLRIWGRLLSEKMILKVLNPILEARASKFRTNDVYVYNWQRYYDLQKEYRVQAAFIGGLSSHIEALCDFLIYRAANSASLEQDWEWKAGDAVPLLPKWFRRLHRYAPEGVPSHFICPLSQKLLDDPVSTCDGFTFERNDIKRWLLQTGLSSPVTGLPLENAELSVNNDIANQIRQWSSGNEVIASHMATRSRWKRDQLVSLELTSSLGSFKRNVPLSLSIDGIYELAFRELKGEHPNLQLYCNNQLLHPFNKTLSSLGIRNGSIIRVNYADDGDPSSHQTENYSDEHMCLIRVYNDYDASHFSFWTTNWIHKSMAMIIFRAWRYCFTKDPLQPIRDLKVGIVKNHDGDCHRRGLSLEHWDSLNSSLSTYYTVKVPGGVTHCLKLNVGTKPLVFKEYEDKDFSGKHLSRLEVFDVVFNTFLDRLLSYELQTHIGLVAFNTTATVYEDISPAVEALRPKFSGFCAGGDTALWDALWLASDEILNYAKKFPNAKRRIICFSDGHDNSSKKDNKTLSLFLFANNIVLDSICLGREDNRDLRKVSHLSGGYKFAPKFLGQAIEICEMDPVLSSMDRPDLDYSKSSYNKLIASKKTALSEVAMADMMPEPKTHPNLKDSFVLIASTAGNSQFSSPLNSHSDANLRISRIQIEIRNIVANPHCHFDVYLSESNTSFWKVVMQGPPESAYSTGTFVLYIDMDENFPQSPPKCRFVTPIYHPSISSHGRICHKILGHKWTPDTTILQLIFAICSLLLVPEYSDPINNYVTFNFLQDEVAFNEQAKLHIQKNATKTRGEWKAEILGE